VVNSEIRERVFFYLLLLKGESKFREYSMKTNIAVLRVQVEGSRRELDRLHAVYKAAEEAFQASNADCRELRLQYEGIVLKAFHKAYPGGKRALAALDKAQNDYSGRLGMHALVTDAEYNGDDSEEYGYRNLREDAFEPGEMKRFRSAFDKVEASFRLSDGHKATRDLAAKLSKARASLAKIRGRTRRTYDLELALANDFLEELWAVQSAADKAKIELGYLLEEVSQLRRARYGKKR
jgi:hypothetical protein